MGFKQQHKDYKSYESEDYFVAELPRGFASALHGFVARHCPGDRALQSATNDMAAHIPAEGTSNYGRSWLLEDLGNFAPRLCKKSLINVMDFLESFVKNSTDVSAEDLNDFLEEEGIGYELEGDRWSGGYSWKLRASVSSRVEKVEDAVLTLAGLCDQTLGHLLQAKDQLANITNHRARKDALRDCLSAMETLLKKLSGEADIKAATAKLRQSDEWGPGELVKEGLSLWNKMHELYPDVRHGNPKKTELGEADALYWIDRITCFIAYLSRVARK